MKTLAFPLHALAHDTTLLGDCPKLYKICTMLVENLVHKTENNLFAYTFLAGPPDRISGSKYKIPAGSQRHSWFLLGS